MTLGTYCEPIRKTPVDEIDTEAVLSVLKPLWTRAPETASRLRGRIEAVLDAAKAHGFIGRNEANPALWRGHLDKLLPKQSKLSRGHHAAMPYAEFPAFVAGLRRAAGDGGAGAGIRHPNGDALGRNACRALGGNRPGRKGLDGPGGADEGGARASRSPSDRAIAILKDMEKGRTGENVFPGQRKDRPLSNMAFEMLLRRIGSQFTAHGFRSSFRDWAGNETHFPRELAEHALAHVIGDKAEQAYRRSDALARRRELMDAWGRHCEGGAGENVVAFKRPA